jgi:hypothetical protein
MNPGDGRRRPDSTRRLVGVIGFGLWLLTIGPPASAQTAQQALTIQTVPPLSGAQFALDGSIFTSDENGVAAISAGPGRHVLEALPLRELPGLRAEFDRWGDDFFRPRRPIDIGSSGEALEVGYDVSYKVTLRFVGLEGEKVSPKRVTSVTLRSSLGGLKDLKDPGPHWLQAARTIRRSTGLEYKQVQWSVEEAFVDGSNVVNRTEQRFTIEEQERWTIRLLLYSVTFTSKDALLGSPIGTHVVLEYPDGSVRRVPLDEDGIVEVTALARGHYEAHVAASGISPATPISVSRAHQEAELKVISYLDLGLFAFVMIGLAVGLAFIGRPRLRSAVRSKLRFRWGVHSDERMYPPI